MEDQATVPIPVVPVLTDTKIIPLIKDETLAEPTNMKATYSASKNQLTYTCNITIPVELTLADVSILQYYDNADPGILDFYFVYDYAGHVLSGVYRNYDLRLTALTKDLAGNAIPMQLVTVIGSLIEDTDPKTSRRTVTTVRSITGEENE